VGRSLLEVYTEEFPHHSKTYYQKCMAHGMLRCVTRAALREPLHDEASLSSTAPPSTTFTGPRSAEVSLPLSTTTPRKNILRRVTKRCRALDGSTSCGRTMNDIRFPQETSWTHSTGQEGADGRAKQGTADHMTEANAPPRKGEDAASRAPPPLSDSSSSPPPRSFCSLDTIPSPILQHGDVVLHTVHRHEIPVAMGDTGVDALALVAVRIHRYGLLVVQKPSGVPTHATGRYYYNSAVAMLSYVLAPRRLHAWLVEEDPLLQSVVTTHSLSVSEKEELWQYYAPTPFGKAREGVLDQSRTAAACVANEMGHPSEKEEDGEEEATTTTTTAEVSLAKAPRPCHRLDRATSGVLLLGVSDAATARLSTALMQKTHAMTAGMTVSPPHPTAVHRHSDPTCASSPPVKVSEAKPPDTPDFTSPTSSGLSVSTLPEGTCGWDVTRVGVFKRYVARVYGQWGGASTSTREERENGPPLPKVRAREDFSPPAFPSSPSPPLPKAGVTREDFSSNAHDGEEEEEKEKEERRPVHAVGLPWPVENAIPVSASDLDVSNRLTQQLAARLLAFRPSPLLPLALGNDHSEMSRPHLFSLLASLPLQGHSRMPKGAPTDFPCGVLLTAPVSAAADKTDRPTRTWPAATLVQRLDRLGSGMPRDVSSIPGALPPPLLPSSLRPMTTPSCCRTDGSSLLLCLPLTGRLHQIRSHLRDYGHPIVGEEEIVDDAGANVLPPPSREVYGKKTNGEPPEGAVTAACVLTAQQEDRRTIAPKKGSRPASSPYPTRDVVYFDPETLPRGYRRLQAGGRCSRTAVASPLECEERSPTHLSHDLSQDHEPTAIPTNTTEEMEKEEESEPLCYECAHWLPLAVLPFPSFGTVSSMDGTSDSPPHVWPLPSPLTPVSNGPTRPPLHPLRASFSAFPLLCLHAWSYTVEESLLLSLSHPETSPSRTSLSVLPSSAHGTRASPKDHRVVASASMPSTPHRERQEKTEERMGGKGKVSSEGTTTTTTTTEGEGIAIDTEYCWRTTLPFGDVPSMVDRHMNASSSPSSRTWVTFCSGRIPEWAF